MPPLLDAHVLLAPEMVVAAPRAVPAERFPTALYDLSHPVGNAEREPWSGAMMRSLVHAANFTARVIRVTGSRH